MVCIGASFKLTTPPRHEQGRRYERHVDGDDQRGLGNERMAFGWLGIGKPQEL